MTTLLCLVTRLGASVLELFWLLVSRPSVRITRLQDITLILTAADDE